MVSIYRSDDGMSYPFVGATDYPGHDADVAANLAHSGRVAARGGSDPVGARLTAAGLSVTGPRRLVLLALEGRMGADTAAEVCDLLQARGTRLGLTSVYRVLRAFSLVGLVHAFSGSEQRFRLCSPASHSHLICDRCGRVIEVPEDRVRAWLEPTYRAAGFVADVVRTDIHGVCALCVPERVDR
jgi:Fur family ferric uptake transcriptional regulator